MKKLLQILIISLLIIVQSTNLLAQNNPDLKRTYHWYFGDHAGIDFSSGIAVADTNGKMNVYAGCSVISDTGGNLLFYTNGVTIWNKNHDTLLNGTGLYGGGTPYQGSVIVPQPNNDSIYFIFHQPGFESAADPHVYGLNYSIVNMKGDNALGEVINKNIHLFKPNTEQLAAIHHANKCDVWVMAHEYHTNNYHAFIVTSTGVDTMPVTTVIGNQIPDSSFSFVPVGHGLKFSNDAKKMASGVFWDNYSYPTLFDTLELYDFDNATAVLSNRVAIPDSSAVQFGFSPDGTKLYLSSCGQDCWMYQYDISSNNQSTIISTKTLLFYDPYWLITDYRQTPDGTLMGVKPFRDTIAIIYNPDASGLSCNLDFYAMSLKGRYGFTTLPNFIQSYFGNDTTDNCSIQDLQEISEIGKDNCIHIYPNPFSFVANIEITCIHEANIYQLGVYDALGSKILEFETPNSYFEFKRNDLQDGIYFLKINYNNKFFINKLLIIN